jgi:hypothetical protein
MQVFVAEFQTAFKFAEEHWQWIALGVVVFVGAGFAMRMLTRALHGGKSG